jgi:hypothetical protein
MVGRVKAALPSPTIHLSPLDDQGRPAAWTAPLLGEQGIQGGDSVDLAAAGAAG